MESREKGGENSCYTDGIQHGRGMNFKTTDWEGRSRLRNTLDLDYLEDIPSFQNQTQK